MKTSGSIRLKTIDLFSGCGGLTEGFEMSGLFSTAGIVEWDKPSLDTLTNRLENKWGYKEIKSSAVYFDMQRTKDLINGWINDEKYGSGDGLRKIVKRNDGVDVIVGGPPCQAYSIAGRIRDKDGMKNDYRNYLFETYLGVVKEFRPKAFVFENVLGMLSAKPDGILITELIRNAFQEIGYDTIENLKNAIVDASEYGVPQYRKRLIIVGFDKNYFGHDTGMMLSDFYSRILPSFKRKTKTVGETIMDLPRIQLSTREKSSKRQANAIFVKNHVPRFHNPRDVKIFRELALDIGRKKKKYKSIDDLKRLYTKMTGKKSNIHKYYVLNPDKPSNTIVAHLYKDGLRHIHPDPLQARSITVREAARLQSFPDDFEFLGSMGDQYKMIGNAVPPLLARAVALSLAEVMAGCQRPGKSPIMSFNDYRVAKV